MRFHIQPEPGLGFILPLTAMLTKAPESLQPDAICEHTTQQNVAVARAPPGPCRGSLQCALTQRL